MYHVFLVFAYLMKIVKDHCRDLSFNKTFTVYFGTLKYTSFGAHKNCDLGLIKWIENYEVSDLNFSRNKNIK